MSYLLILPVSLIAYTLGAYRWYRRGRADGKALEEARRRAVRMYEQNWSEQ